MEQKFGITHIAAIVLVIAGTIFLIAGPSFSLSRQLSDGAGSAIDIDGDQGTQILGVGAAVVIGMTIIGLGLGAGLWFTVRNVIRAEASPDIPTEPLDWRSYGHVGAIVLIGGLFSTVALFFISFSILPVRASAEARTVDTFFLIEGLTIAFIFGLVIGMLIHTLLYYRAREGETGDGKHIHGNLALELGWTIAPLIFVMTLGVFASLALVDITDEEEGEFGVYVEAFQWGWRYYYPTDLFYSDAELEELATSSPNTYNNIIETERGVQQRSGLPGYGIPVPQMYMRLDETVRIDMTSTDVLHAFWVPEFRMKRDAVPGVITDLRYTPILQGEYAIRCAEMCGNQHWAMLGTIQVVSDSDYDTWIEETKVLLGDPVQAGGAIWESQCATCHSIDGSDGTGPTWLNRVGTERAMSDGSQAYGDYEYILESIWFPNNRIVAGYNAGLMPQNYIDVLTESNVQQVFSFMCSVSDVWEEVEDCQPYADSIRTARGEAAGTELAQAVETGEAEE